MQYYIGKTIDFSFEKAIEKVTEALKKEGFGILSEIDIHEKAERKAGCGFQKIPDSGSLQPAQGLRST